MVTELRSDLALFAVFGAIALGSLAPFGLFSMWCSDSHRRRSRAQDFVLPAGLLFASYAAAVLLGLQWASEELASLVWPASGIALAGLLIGGVGFWPAIFLGYFVASRFAGSSMPLWTDAALALATTGAVVIVARLLAKLQMDLRLTLVRDVIRLSAAALGGALIAALLATPILMASGGLSLDRAPRVVISWWLGNSVGCLLVTPPLLVWSHRSAWNLSPQRWLWLAMLLVGAGVLAYAVFFESRLGALRIWYTYPILIWIAVAFKVRGIAIALLIVTSIATWSATVGTGPFASAADSGLTAIALAQHYALITSISALVLAAAADERRNLEALHRSEARENSIVNTAQEPIIVIDEHARIVSFNRAAERSFGYEASEVIGRNINILMPEPHASAHESYMQRYHRTGEKRVIGTTVQVEGRRKDGTTFPLDLSVAEWSSDGDKYFTGIIHEQTERVRAELALRESEQRLATAIEATGGGVYEQSVPAENLLYISPQWLAILGYDSLPVLPGRFDAWIADQVHPDDREFRAEAWRAFISGREPRYDAEVRKRHASGRWIWVRSYAQAIDRSKDGRVTRLSGIMVDITDRRAAETRAEHFARHDTLTGLSNRALFTEKLVEAAMQADAARAHAGLILVDLDHFKEINDTLGHPIGDAILQVVTDRVRASIRSSDTAARLGGDEFAVVVAGAHSRDDIEELAQRLHRAIAQTAVIEGKEVSVAVSIGYAIYPDDAETVELLMRHADLALYDAKRHGRNAVKAFHPPLAAEATNRTRIERELRHAIEDNELVLHYQPQFDLKHGRVHSVEALVRWPREGKPISPSEFIPIAEMSGTIRALGEWTLVQAARQQARWRSQGHAITVAVNVSPVEASAEGFPPLLKRALAEADIPGKALELEITEGLLIDPEKASVRTFLATCEEQGIGLAIDDFGIGYSSLNYLMTLPIAKVKIDRSFVSRLDDHRSATLVEGIVSLGHRLEKRIVAEGVEKEEQLERLRVMGCDDAQGYLLCKPVEPEKVSRMLQHQAEGASFGSRLH